MSQNYSVETNLKEEINIEVRVKLNGEIITFNEFKRAIQTKLDRATKARHLEMPEITTLKFTLTNQMWYFSIWCDEDFIEFNEEKLASRIIANRTLIARKEVKNENIPNLGKSDER